MGTRWWEEGSQVDGTNVENMDWTRSACPGEAQVRPR